MILHMLSFKKTRKYLQNGLDFVSFHSLENFGRKISDSMLNKSWLEIDPGIF